MNKANCDKFLKFLTSHFKSSWNLDNNLQKLIWDKDLNVSKDNAKKFLTETLGSIGNRKLEYFSMQNVFTNIEQIPIKAIIQK